MSISSNVVGDVTLSDIAGAVTGSHRNGDLDDQPASASIELTLQLVTRDVRRASRGTRSLDARNGECEIADVARARSSSTIANVEIDDRRGHAGPVRIGGDGGRVRRRAPARETRVDVRRAEVEVTLDAAVPLTLLTTDETLRLLLDGPPAIDARRDRDRRRHDCTRPIFDCTPETSDRESRLAHVVRRRTAARASLRNRARRHCDRQAQVIVFRVLSRRRMSSPVVLETNLSGLTLARRGKVRDVYDLGEHLLIVATDRISAFDYVLGSGIPDKGKVLTQLSAFWFDHIGDLVPHHVVAGRRRRRSPP